MNVKNKIIKIIKKIDKQILSILNKLFNIIGISIIRNNENSPYVLYHYIDKNGEFDYDRYKSIQEAGNRRKIEKVAVQRSTIELICTFLKEREIASSFGLCHGTRRGLEQKWFKELLQCEVLGTEIASTALQFPDTVQWDFHERNENWIDKADFVYSNSFDHSYDPKRSLNAWLDQLKDGGFLFIEHSSSHTPEKSNEMDPFGAHLSVLPYLLNEWASERYSLAPLLKPQSRQDTDVNVLCLRKIR